MNTAYTVWVYSRLSMSRQPFVWRDIVITLHSLAEVYRILVTLTPQRPLQGVWLLLVDHPSHQVFITCQGHRGETCRLSQPGEKLYKYLNIAIKTVLFYSEMFFITNKFLKLTQSHLEPIWIPSSVKFAVIR